MGDVAFVVAALTPPTEAEGDHYAGASAARAFFLAGPLMPAPEAGWGRGRGGSR